ncbi:restriction endonuclease subunit S [Staphylococcus delphini]|uniref:restriction endonuclease subunit S n=1 Tax=Staphylococcus delphini TaxID=53344 RepID=UPI0023B277EE|nr:restriction endonuclease subunit S [Staphylococcus delphini]MDE9753206.1 restriction endonuclease subunit S [Staphylococcus delphini]MDE9790769.1 restriction endonuclease subunit S [Staphylococcus delphini]MDE9792519.1 restriction endonuclease subunit S [Staphylococcus delphini]MDE9794173.1 restriction endonuclease subunit S [Staphylococcus delphini]MDE9797779.1 restriction endonuclease subunit S [Staphylococcus delphini]
MTEEKKNIPKLRFPGFSEEWEEKRLGELCTFSNGINAKKEQYGHGRKFINVLDILNKNYITYNEIIGKVAVSKEVEHRNKVEYGDLLFLRSSETREEVGTSNVYLDNTFALYGGFVIRGKKVANYDPMFIKNLLNTSKIRNMISASSGGSTRYNVNQEILKKLKLKLTGINEQQKIGDFFSKLDRQIELEEQKLALLEEQKKGYMQKIFSQELRFKDDNGEDYPDWEETMISNIGEVVTGNTPSKKEEEYWRSNEYVWVTPTDITNKKDIYQSGVYLSQKGYEKARKLPKNTLLITCIASIGKNAILRTQGACNQQINGIIPFKEFDIDYLYYAFEDISKLMKKVAGKTATQIVNKKTFENLSLDIPTTLEQQKIGEFFSQLDRYIELQEQKINLFKQRKKGFLQKMFV